MTGGSSTGGAPPPGRIGPGGPVDLDDLVVTWTRPERVYGRVADESIVAGFAENNVGAGLTVDDVVVVASEEDIVTAATEDSIRAATALNMVIAKSPAKDVISGVATDCVVATAAANFVIAERSDDHIIALGADSDRPRLFDDPTVGAVATIVATNASTKPAALYLIDSRFLFASCVWDARTKTQPTFAFHNAHRTGQRKSFAEIEEQLTNSAVM